MDQKTGGKGDLLDELRREWGNTVDGYGIALERKSSSCTAE